MRLSLLSVQIALYHANLGQKAVAVFSNSGGKAVVRIN